jgi:thiamine kinase-like enzyme
MGEVLCNSSSTDQSTDRNQPTAKIEECRNPTATPASAQTISATDEDGMMESSIPHLILDPQYAIEVTTSESSHHTGNPYASADEYRMYARVAADSTSSTKKLVYRVDRRPYIPSWRVESVLNHHATANEFLSSIQSVAAAILLLQAEADRAPEPAVIRQVIPSLSVERVMGGVTNTLYKVSGFHQNSCLAPTFPVDTVLVRLFGAEGLVDRDEETGVFAALSAVHLAPMYYGRFSNGRVEGYQHGTRPLHFTELSGVQNNSMSRGIATRLARLHYGFRILPLLPPERRQPTLWKQLYDWLDQAEMALPSLQLNPRTITDLQLSKVRTELLWLQEEVRGIIGNNEEDAVVFCHNDLLAANILYNDSTETIELIDFEYGGINYRAFDIANHFNEYAGGPPTDAIPKYQLLPNDQQQRFFVRTYLETAVATTSVTSTAALPSQDAATKVEPISEAQVDAMLREVQIFGLANHLYWGLWAINQASTEGCAVYDYLTYAVCRIRQYWSTKPTAPQILVE